MSKTKKIKSFFLQKKYQLIIKSISNKSEDYHNYSSWRLHYVAKACVKTKDFNKAIDIYKYLSFKYNNPIFISQLASCYSAIGNYNNIVESDFINAIELSNYEDGNIIFNYYNYLLSSSTYSNKKVMKYYNEKIFINMNSRKKLLISSLLFMIGESYLGSRIISLMYDNENERKIFVKSLFILDKLREKKYELNSNETYYLNLYDLIKENQISFENYIKNAKKISIIGNSPSELGKKNKAVIDSCDVVIRFNNFDLRSYKLQESYGSRTDVWVRSLGDWVNKRDKDTFDYVIISGNALEFKYTNWDNLKKYFQDDHKALVLDEWVYNDLVQELESIPSAGLALFYFIYKLVGIEKCHIFGFSFIDQLEKGFTNIGGTVAGVRHNWNKEKELFEKIINNEI